MLYVIGGNLQQATDYIRGKRLHQGEAVAMTNPLQQLPALHAPEVVLVGTYIVRPDRHHIDAMLELIGAVVRFDAA